jgi:NAD(P)-dependent dehydrogenase (short-subunit alcohol dehydrogenase family)
VQVVDLDREGALQTCSIANTEQVQAYPAIADVTNRQQVHATVKEALEHFGHLDILVNNAGLGIATSFEKVSEEEWDLLVNTNLKSAFLFSQAVLPEMIRQNYGRIVNFSSQAARTGGIVVSVAYSAAKAGVICLTKTLAQIGAKHGITANAVAPGVINTPFLESMPGSDRFAERIPMGRIGRPDEVAQVVLFLASNDASYITGATLDVNGGMVMS